MILWNTNANYDQSIYFGNTTFTGFNITLQTSNILGRPVQINNNGSEWDMLLYFITQDPDSGTVLNSDRSTTVSGLEPFRVTRY